MRKTKQWAHGGMLISDLVNDKLIVGKKLVPIVHDFAFAMPNSVFKVKRLLEPQYTITKVAPYTENTFIIVMKGKDDIYSMIGESDLFTGMDLIN